MTAETPYRLAALALVITAFSISGYFRRRAEAQGGPMSTTEGGRRLIVLRLIGLMAILPLLGYLINPAWVAWARFEPPSSLRWSAGLVALASLPLFYWIFASLGPNISPTQNTRRGHQLVTHGPYRYVRHPLYTAGLLFFLSIAILTGLWWLIAGLLVGMPVLMARTPREEARLLEQFGEEYRAYTRQTGRYLPRPRR